MEEAEFNLLVRNIADELNARVFPAVDRALEKDPSLRRSLNPAFPFPRKLRIGLLGSHLVVEYVGPEDPSNEKFSAEGLYRPDWTVFQFLGIDVSHLRDRGLPFPRDLENLQIFLGDAIGLLGDYMYDVVANPNTLMLNNYPDFTVGSEPTCVSNVTFLWSDPDGGLRVRRIDFLELMPVQEGGWPYHSEESLEHFAQYILNKKVPSYQVALHRTLNEFTELVEKADTTEPEITIFLAQHPEILQLAFGADELHPETKLEWQYDSGKPDLKPDFMPVKMDGYSDILEFKLPRLKRSPMVGTANRSHPSSEVEAALAQVDQYAEWAAQEVNQRWLETTKGIKVHHPRTHLVIGHSDDFSAEDRQRLRSRRNATISTYDEFVTLARMQLYRVH